MNCDHCGAPLRVEEGQNYFHCQYCGSFEFPIANQDGVGLLGEVSSHICPVCDKPLVSAVVQNIPILSCPDCRGNLISQLKLIPILRRSQPANPLSGDTQNNPNRTEFTREYLCPSCRKGMTVYNYGGPGNIVIQGCSSCQQIWLDYGELGRMISANWEMEKRSQDLLEAQKRR